jgi:hypothetical protein
MRSADHFHSPAPEDLMEYVDGEGSEAARAAIETHLAACAACQAIVADQCRLTTTMQAWHVPPAPSSLEVPQTRPARAWWRPSRGLAAGLAAAAVVLVVVALQQRPRPSVARTTNISLRSQEAAAPAPPALPAIGGAVRGGRPNVAGNLQGQTTLDKLTASPAAQTPPLAPRGPSVIRTARLQLVTKDFATARQSVESIVTANGGFVDDLTVTGNTAEARALRGTVRVRSERFGDAMTRLRELGVVIEDTQGTQDVTDQLVDLDARLAASRATEQRLTELLRNRTGRLSDVLEVERELTRVRVDIERLDAEKTNVTRRVSYATINITVTEERKESLDGPLPLTTQLKVAALDGLESVIDSVAATVLLALRAGPVLLFWGALLAIVALSVRRFGIRGFGMQDPR